MVFAQFSFDNLLHIAAPKFNETLRSMLSLCPLCLNFAPAFAPVIDVCAFGHQSDIPGLVHLGSASRSNKSTVAAPE